MAKRDVLERVWLAIEDCFKKNASPLTIGQALVWIGKQYPELNEATVGAQIRGSVDTESNRKHRRVTPKILLKDGGSYRLISQERSNEQYTHDEDDSESNPENSEDSLGQAFALESHLRDYLALHLSELEAGLELWSNQPPSVEYQISSRRIDILARDKEGIPVVVELKLNKAYDRVVGQALYYRALVRKILKKPRVRVFLVATEISEELELACSDLSDLHLREYGLSLKIRPVTGNATSRN